VAAPINTRQGSSGGLEPLSRICGEVLELDEVPADASFGALGGTSIKALAVMAGLSALGLSVKVADLLGTSALGEVATRVVSLGAPSEEPPSAEFVLTPPQRVLMSLPGHSVARGADLIEYLKVDVFDVTGRAVTPEAATRALRALVKRHDALRTRLTPGRRISLGLQPEEFAVGPVVAYDGTAALSDVIFSLLPDYRPADEPLVRLSLVDDVPARRTLLVFAAHHLVCDLISWQVLCRDLDTALGQVLAGQQADLPVAGASWGQWAREVERYERDGHALAEVPYWAALPVDRVTDLPLDHPGGSNSFELLDTVTTRAACPDGLAGPVVIAALADVLAPWQDTDTVHLALRYHGRAVPELGVDVAGTVGAFTTAHPLLLRLPRDADAPSLVGAVADQVAAVPSGGLGFGLLRRPLGPPHPVVADFPSPQVLLDYHGGRFWRPDTHAAVLRPSGVELLRRPQPGGTRPFVLRVHVSAVDRTLSARWEFSRGLHEPATIGRLAGAMADRVGELADGGR
jgi:hypothetical protein